MALDMETGGVSMIPLHGLQKTQQVSASRASTTGVPTTTARSPIQTAGNRDRAQPNPEPAPFMGSY